MREKASYEELEARVKHLEAALASNHDAQQSVIKALSEGFAALVNRSQDGIYQFDLDSRTFPFFNQRFLSLYSIEDQGKRILSPYSVKCHIHPDDLEKVKEARSASLQPGSEGGEVEYRFLHSDGGTYWMHDRWSVLRDESGQAIAIEGFVRDNTKRRQAEDELERSRNSALIGGYITRRGRFVRVNPEFCRITGYSRDELLGMLSIELVQASYKDQVRENAIEMLKGRRSTPYEFCIVDKQGQVKWIMETVTAIKHEGRRAALGYFMDISSRKQAEAERLEREKLQAILEMAGAVGHEFNSPLQVILTCAEKLSQATVDDRTRTKLIRLLQQNTKKLVALSRKIQNISTYKTRDYVCGKTIIDIHDDPRKPAPPGADT